jgi:nucleolar protein 4
MTSPVEIMETVVAVPELSNEQQNQNIASSTVSIQKKERKPRSETSNTTLFIRNVPFDCENPEFEAFFSEFGPLKGCFVVKDPIQEGRCRGIGFVHFAMPEDADKTLKALTEGASKFRGRSLQADWAHKKNLELSASGLTATIKPAIKASISAPKNVLVEAEKMQECTKLVLHFEQDMLADSKLLKALIQRLRRFAPIKESICPYMEDNTKVMLEYTMPKANYMVYRKLFSKINTCLLESKQIGSEDVENTAVAIKKTQKLFVNRSCILKGVEPILPEPVKAFRLIIRNLPFNITRSTQLTEYFLPYGEILEMNIPTVKNESQRHGDNDALRGRGFGFVQYSKRTEAEKAMEALNGSIIKTRAIAVDWALAKSVYDKLENKDVESEKAGESEVADEAVVASDEAVESDAEDDITDDIEDASDIEKQIDVEHMDNFGNSDDDEEDQNEQISNSSTIFIRNLSFDTEEDDLEEYFASKIPGSSIEYCKIVRNPDTGASRGTGFIKFMNSRSAQEAIEISSKAPAMPSDGQLADLAEKRTRKGFQSIVNDPDALMPDQAAGFILNGRLLNVTLAVDRKEASELGRRRALDKISSILNEDGRDKILDQIFAVPIGKAAAVTANQIPRLKRNLALINESVPAADDSELSASEIKARESVIQSRARSSAKNPNLMLSTTRLAVHHLPPRVNESQLKDVIYAGVKEARAYAMKPGNPMNLSKKMLALLPQFENVSKIHSGMHQIKIILHKSKKSSGESVDEKTTAKSRGYGFVEWRHPLMALLCVRWFRRSSSWSTSGISQLIKSRARALARDFPNDPEAQISTPVVEFATEKLNILKKRTNNGKREHDGVKNESKKRFKRA